MSQSETLMLIVLGIAIATFMALILGRLAWKLALRIGARRVQRNVPVTVVDLQNDRDRLRAEQAILSRKIEVRLDEMKLRMAEQAAEVTRNRNRVETLMQQITDQDAVIASREAEIARLSSLVTSLEREVASTRLQSDDLQEALTAKQAEVAGMHEKFLAKLDEAKIPVTPAPFVMDEATSRLTNRIRSLTARPEPEPEAPMTPSAPKKQSFDGSRILVKPAGTQEVQAKAKAKLAKKAARVERPVAPVETQVEKPVEIEAEPVPMVVNAPAPVAVEATTTAPDTAPSDAPKAAEEVQGDTGKTGVTNVISLAQRIKALQREIAS